MNYICLICGFDKLYEPPYDKYSCASFEICPCCGTEFGYHIVHPNQEKITLLKEKWIKNGMIFNNNNRIPLNWSSSEQLKNLNKIDVTNNVYESK